MIGVYENVITFPRDGLRPDNEVFVVDDKGKAAIRKVEVLDSNADRAVLRSGVTPGELIVLSPLERSRIETPLKVLDVNAPETVLVTPLITWFVRNPIAANLIMVAMFVVGVFGYFSMEREFIPQTTINGMTVTVSWPGASPRDVEEQLIVRIEESVDGLDGIDYIEATARESGGSVNIRTKLRIDYEKLLDEVKSRVDAIQNLPPDSFRPQIIRWDARPEIMYLALHGDVDPLTLQRAANDVRLEITKLSGLQLTEQISKRPEQVTIEIASGSGNIRFFY